MSTIAPAAFSRITAMLAIAQHLTEHNKVAYLATYQSRGHGKTKGQAAPVHKHMAAVRKAKAVHNTNKRK